MPFPLLIAIPSAMAFLGELLAVGGGIWQAIQIADAVGDWFESDAAAQYLANQINARLAAAGIELILPPLKPWTEEGRDDVRAVIEGFVLDSINAKTGAQFTSLAELNQDKFLEGVGAVLAGRINTQTGSKIGAVWPVDALKSQLQTEVARQFDNRGRYAGGTLFRAKTMKLIKEKIAQKHPELMAQVKAITEDGPWGPPINEAHRQRREDGKARQLEYRKTHQQVWQEK